jgi:hypothetical protein
MSTRSGLSSQIVKYTIPSTATGIAFTNLLAPVTNIDAGRYLVQVAYAVSPLTAGATVNSVTYSLTTTAILGGIGAVGLIQHVASAASIANATNKCSNMGVITIAADDTPVYFSLTATLSVGNYQSSIATLDANANVISFVKIA